MKPRPTAPEQLLALREGRAFVDLSPWRKLRVTGTDAGRWLNDLVSAELGALDGGQAVASLLLSPTGRIRAEFTVARLGDGWLLVQDPLQPASVGELLDPYVLSSDVALEDRTGQLSLLALPGPAEATPDRPGPASGPAGYRPSALGEGLDLVGEDRDGLAAAVGGRVEASEEAVEVWRVERGVPRLGVDLDQDALPHETPLERAISYTKGCFLGQEAVAKVRNLGHPPFVLRAVRADGQLSPGDAVMAGDESVGRVTSGAALPEGGAAGIVRIRWTARDAGLRTESGTRLAVSAPAAGAG